MEPPKSGGGGNNEKPPVTYSFTAALTGDSDGKGSIRVTPQSSGNSYKPDTAITVEAQPEQGNSFAGWFDAATGGNLISGAAKYNFNITKSSTLYAKFITGANKALFSAGKTADSSLNGTIAISPQSPTGSYDKGTTITAEAQGDGSTSFMGWFDRQKGGKLISVDSRYSFTLNESRAIYALFMEGSGKCSFSANRTADSSGSGTISVNPNSTNAIYNMNSMISVTAHPDSSTAFLGWYDAPQGGTLISTEATHTLPLTKSTILYARFLDISNRYSFQAGKRADSRGNGTVTILPQPIAGSYYDKGTTITVEAQNDASTSFMGWFDSKEGGNLISVEQRYTFMIKENRALYALFIEGSGKCSFSANRSTDSSGNGTITINNKSANSIYDMSSLITITAQADASSFFEGWFDAPEGGNLISTEANYSHPLTYSTIIYARFKDISNQCKVITGKTADSKGKGTITILPQTPTGGYDKGTAVTVEIQYDASSYFMGWFDAATGGNLISLDSRYSFTINENRALYARLLDQWDKCAFSAKKTTESSGNGTITISPNSPNSIYNMSSTISLTAHPDANSGFAGWYDAPQGGNLISAEANYSFPITYSTIYYARFRDITISYKLVTEAEKSGDGEGSIIVTPKSSTGSYINETEISVEAQPEASSTFTGWFDAPQGGNLISSQAKYSFTITKESALYAGFEKKSYTLSTAPAQDGDGIGQILATSTANGSYKHGTAITVEAQADPSSSFAGWFDAPQGGNLLSGESKYSFTITQNSPLYAKFTIGTEQLFFSAKKSLDGKGTGTITLTPQSPNSIYKLNTAIKVEAQPESGSFFIGWFDAARGGSAISREKVYSLTLTANRAIYAHFGKFSDANLENEVRAKLKRSTGELSYSELVGIEKLYAMSTGYSRAIYNLEGIEYLTGLKVLDLSRNQVRDISPLSNLTGLQDLELDDNPVENLAVLANLTNLTKLNLSNCRLESITPLAKLTNLTELLLSSNQFTDISPLSALTNLTTIVLESCYLLKDITPLEGLTKLNLINLSTNEKLTDIGPLVRNSGLGSGDTVYVIYSPNVNTAQISALRSRGVKVLQQYEM